MVNDNNPSEGNAQTTAITTTTAKKGDENETKKMNKFRTNKE